MRWLFTRFVARRLLQNPFRLVLLIGALALATSLWMSVLSASLASVKSLEGSVGLSQEEYPLSVTAGGRIDLKAVASCMVGLERNFAVTGIRREGGIAQAGMRAEPVRVIGVTAASAGGMATQEVAEGEMLITRDLAQKLGFTDGSPLSLSVDGRTINGTGQTLKEGLPGRAADAVMIPLSMLGAANSDAKLDALFLKPIHPLVLKQARTELAQWFASCGGEGVFLRVESVAQRLEQGEQLLAAYRMNISVMALVTLVVCGLLVWHAASLSLLGITRELSIVRTLGMTRLAAAFMVIGESALVGVCGALAGLTIGAPLTLAMTELLLTTARDIYHTTLSAEGSFSGSLLAKALSLILVTGVCILGAVGAAYRAAQISPSVGTRRESVAVRTLALRPALGAALVASTVVALLTLRLYFGPSAAFAYLLVAACVVWTLACVPLFLLGAGPLAHLATLLSPASARVAGASVCTFARGHALGVMGVALAITLMTSLSLMVGSFRYTLEQWVASRLQGDLYISVVFSGAKAGESRMSDEVVMRLAALPGVSAAAPYYEASGSIGEHPVRIAGATFAIQLAQGVYKFSAGTAPEPPYRGEMIVSESAARKLGLYIGSRVPFAGKEFSVRAIMQEFSTEQPLLLVDTAEFRAAFPGQGADTLSLYAAPGADMNALSRAAERVLPQLLVVRDQRELVEYVMIMFDRTFRITESVRWIVFLIAGAGLVVSFVQHLWERCREIKTLRVIGASRTQIVAATTIECGLVCACAGPVGVLGGVLLGWALVEHVNPVSFGWSLEFSPTVQPIILTALFSFALCISVALCAVAVLGRIVEHATLADE